MRRILISLVFLGLLLSPLRSVQAQAAVTLQNVGVEYTFGEKITFSATIQTTATIQTAYLLFQVEGDPNTHTEPIKVGSTGKTAYTHFIQNGLIRPFAKVFYWYHLILVNNPAFDSSQYSFQYDDNRYEWQTLENDNLALNWAEGDLAFGQAAFDAANAGFQAFQQWIPVQTGGPIKIYIYPSAAEVQNTLNLGGYTWVGGHASPDLGVVLVSIAPGETQAIEMERQIPHELAHVLLYRLTGPAYSKLPTWLLEGIASQAERYPNSNYAQALSLASQNRALLPLSGLCGPFPADASGATLAYAESDSFIRYIQATYGTSSLRDLVQAYTDGLTCEQGVQRAFGVSLVSLDQGWRQDSLGEKASSAAWQNLLPFLVLLVLMLVVPAWRLLGIQKRGSYGRPDSK